MTILWIVGKAPSRKGDENFDIVGVFSDEKIAIEACITSYHFVGPLELNEIYADGCEWHGAYYPIKFDEK